MSSIHFSIIHLFVYLQILIADLFTCNWTIKLQMNTVLCCSSAFMVGKQDDHWLWGTVLWTQHYLLWGAKILKWCMDPNEGSIVQVKMKGTVASAEAVNPSVLYSGNLSKGLDGNGKSFPVKSVNISPTTTTRKLKFVFHWHNTYRSKHQIFYRNKIFYPSYKLL